MQSKVHFNSAESRQMFDEIKLMASFFQYHAVVAVSSIMSSIIVALEMFRVVILLIIMFNVQC